MKCPVDGTELLMAERVGVEIDYCPQCRGVWLDRGELDKIIEKATPAVELADPDPYIAPSPAVAPRARPDQYDTRNDRSDRRTDDRRYARDDDDDDDHRYSERYSKHGKHDKYGRKKKRKSILSEIFDAFD